MEKSFHAGAFFESIGVDFSTLERSSEVINADVLDAWFDPTPKIFEKISEYLPFIIRTSPPNYSEGLIQTISEVRGIPKENILAGGGSSNLIFIFFQQMVEKDDIVMVLDPMYGEYSHVLEQVIGADVFRHKLKKENQFRLQTSALVDEIHSVKPKMLVLVNPNSPTGQYLAKEEVYHLLDAVPKDITVVSMKHISSTLEEKIL